ncbi:MAG: cysteine desulfurase, partial [Clostridia bacterium]|nr:cysteine desulfurase [Clostridia bacterium]
RAIIAERLSAQPGEVYFTSGGTESDNIAILGAAYAKKRAGNRIVTTAIEHPAVLNTMAQLEKEGFEVVYVQPEADGNIPAEKFAAVIDAKTILVSVMTVNNETGAVLPLKEIAGIIKRKKAPALFHTDAVQAFCKLPVSPKKLGLDLISVSGHKVHAPKGVGALYVKSGVRILPHSFGGGQEKNLRPGTEGVPQICAFGAAVKAMPAEREAEKAVREVRDHLLMRLGVLPEVTLNSPENAMPYIVNLSAGRVRAETMLHFLAEKGIYVSSGSACGKAKPSHVLTAMGLSQQRIDTSLRVSLCAENTKEEIDAFADALKEGLATLSHT